FGAGLFPYGGFPLVEPEYRSWIDKKPTMCPVQRARGTIKQATAKVVTRQRRPTLASVARQANQAGTTSARYGSKPRGTIVVVTGQGEQQQDNEVDEWIAKHADKTQRH